MNEKIQYEVEYKQRNSLPTPNGEITIGEIYIKAKGASVKECIELADRFIEKKGKKLPKSKKL